MKVYQIIQSDYDGDDPRGIFATRELAEELIKEDGLLGCTIEEQEVIESIPPLSDVYTMNARWIVGEAAPSNPTRTSYKQRFDLPGAADLDCWELHNPKKIAPSDRINHHDWAKVTGTDEAACTKLFDETLARIIAERMGIA